MIISFGMNFLNWFYYATTIHMTRKTYSRGHFWTLNNKCWTWEHYFLPITKVKRKNEMRYLFLINCVSSASMQYFFVSNASIHLYHRIVILDLICNQIKMPYQSSFGLIHYLDIYNMHYTNQWKISSVMSYLFRFSINFIERLLKLKQINIQFFLEYMIKDPPKYNIVV